MSRILAAAWRRGGLAALAVAVVASWPSEARACGGFPLPMPAEGETGEAIPPEAPATLGEAMAEAHPLPQPHRPCEGPVCSSDSSLPTTPPPTLGGAQQDHRVILAGVLDAIASTRGERADNSPSVHPIRVASSVFHPPR